MGYVYELEHVSKIYKNDGKEFEALKDVNLTVEEGEIFGIIGMSGAGKSTLVRTLNRLEEISEGKVLFYGNDLAELKPRELRNVRHSISMSFQGFNLLQQRTVIENVEQPLRIAGMRREERRKIARQMLRVVGLEEKENVYPARLSGGQRQRVAIARALTADPKVLLCDEATSALDPKMTGEILELLKKINEERGLTIVIITHEMSVVEKICDRVAIIDEGRLAEVGEVREVFSNPQSAAAKKLVSADSMSSRRCRERHHFKVYSRGDSAWSPAHLAADILPNHYKIAAKMKSALGSVPSVFTGSTSSPCTCRAC